MTFKSTNSWGPSNIAAIVALASTSPSWRRSSCSLARAFSSLFGRLYLLKQLRQIRFLLWL